MVLFQVFSPARWTGETRTTTDDPTASSDCIASLGPFPLSVVHSPEVLESAASAMLSALWPVFLHSFGLRSSLVHAPEPDYRIPDRIEGPLPLVDLARLGSMMRRQLVLARSALQTHGAYDEHSLQECGLSHRELRRAYDNQLFAGEMPLTRLVELAAEASMELALAAFARGDVSQAHDFLLSAIRATEYRDPNQATRIASRGDGALLSTKSLERHLELSLSDLLVREGFAIWSEHFGLARVRAGKDDARLLGEVLGFDALSGEDWQARYSGMSPGHPYRRAEDLMLGIQRRLGVTGVLLARHAAVAEAQFAASLLVCEDLGVFLAKDRWRPDRILERVAAATGRTDAPPVDGVVNFVHTAVVDRGCDSFASDLLGLLVERLREDVPQSCTAGLIAACLEGA